MITESKTNRRGGAKIAPEVVEKRLKQGAALVEEKNKSKEKYKELASWLNLNEKEAYKFYIVGLAFGGENTKLFHLPHLYATNWAVILQCSGQQRDLSTRHAVMALVHYSMYLAERNMPISSYAIPNDLPYVKGVLKLSDIEIRTLFVSMMNERGVPLTDEEQKLLSIDTGPLFNTISTWANYYKDRERYNNGSRNPMQEEISAAIEDLYAGSGDLSFESTLLEEQCLHSIMSSAANTEDYSMDTVDSQKETEIVVAPHFDAQDYLKSEINKFLATYVPPAGEELEVLRRLNTDLNARKLEQDTMIVELLEENETLRGKLQAAEETLGSVETMISNQLADARAMIVKKQQ